MRASDLADAKAFSAVHTDRAVPPCRACSAEQQNAVLLPFYRARSRALGEGNTSQGNANGVCWLREGCEVRERRAQLQ